MAKGYFPLDQAIVLAGLSESDLHEWTPGNTIIAVPTIPPAGAATGYDKIMFAVKTDNPVTNIRFPMEGYKVFEWSNSSDPTPEEIADVITAAINEVR